MSARRSGASSIPGLEDGNADEEAEELVPGPNFYLLGDDSAWADASASFARAEGLTVRLARPAVRPAVAPPNTAATVAAGMRALGALGRDMAFENVLATDRATHGVDNYSIPTQTVDDVQREVDDTISAAAANKATSVPAAATTTALTEEPEETQDA
ncbi:hypothetical protein K438DRAFT_1983902 [Mycena galopus ATCC 62051]|nr:hypothetical protein K438DRAFT_1983902 [Mycena galopus ATCC 62051]